MKYLLSTLMLLTSFSLISQNDTIYKLYEVTSPPVFPGYIIDTTLSKVKNFEKSIFLFVLKNAFLTGKKTSQERVFVEIVIDENGLSKITNVRATSKPAKRVAVKAIKKLPVFIPASLNNKNVKMIFTLPITFNVILLN